MNRIFKRIVSGMVAAAAAATAVFIAPPEISLTATASAETKQWTDEYKYRSDSAVFSVDTKTVYGDSDYSIKLENTDYNVSYVVKRYVVEPETKYIFSAMVKYSGYSLKPDWSGSLSGAALGLPNSYTHGNFSVSKDWTMLEFEFTTGKEKVFDLALYNGMFRADCRGTAWFCGLKLEKAGEMWVPDSVNTKDYTVSVDTGTKYGDSPYSIKLTNNTYCVGNVRKTFQLEPETSYKFSAMVKYSGLKIKPGSESSVSGACLSQFWTYDNSGMTSDSSWKKLEYIFKTGKDGKYTLALQNGIWNSLCKGTAWFSDIKLEKSLSDTNNWDVLVMVMKNINAKAIVDGKTIQHKASLTDSDAKYLAGVVNELKTVFPEISKGLVSINDIDVFASSNVITELNTDSIVRNKMDLYTKSVSDALDKQLVKKNYNQIIIFAPLDGVNTGWAGYGGTQYKGYYYAVYSYKSGSEVFTTSRTYEGFHTSGLVHEILHGVESASKQIDPDTPDLHSNITTYKKYYSEEKDRWYSYYSDYMTHSLPDGKGVVPEAFYRSGGNYVLVSDDMTPGYGVSGRENLPTPISSVITVSKIADKYYGGSAVKPAVTVKGATKGTDYTISYSNNNAPGTAQVIIRGKGRYTGSVTVDFNIRLKKTTAKITNPDLVWGKVPGADGYEIYYSKDGAKYKKLLDTTALKYDLSKLTSGSYKLIVRSYSGTGSGRVYSDWSKAVSATKK